jgi:hypothetical protein
MWFFKVPLMLPGRTVSRSLSPLPRTVTANHLLSSSVPFHKDHIMLRQKSGHRSERINKIFTIISKCNAIPILTKRRISRRLAAEKEQGAKSSMHRKQGSVHSFLGIRGYSSVTDYRFLIKGLDCPRLGRNDYSAFAVLLLMG